MRTFLAQQIEMPHPVAATGECTWCGDRALLYMRARDGTEVERPACRPCVERGCGVVRDKNHAGCFEQGVAVQHRGCVTASGAENDSPMCGEQQHQRAVLHNQAPQIISAHMVAEREPHSMCSPISRMPMAVCMASNDLLCRKRANGGMGISIGPVGGVGEIDTARSPYKRQRTAFTFSET